MHMVIMADLKTDHPGTPNHSMLHPVDLPGIKAYPRIKAPSSTSERFNMTSFASRIKEIVLLLISSKCIIDGHSDSRITVVAIAGRK